MTPEFKFVAGMALLRLLSAAVEVTAAVLMLRFGRVETAFKINAVLGLVGPFILIGVTSLGLFGMAGKISYEKLIAIVVGVLLILYGARSG